ncbi:hypothetical protein CEE58_01870 [Stenotrophomonas maltophilia]|nr:hypothetical protein CEE58_01870 [Stenotrophomonas maltophilia]
MLLKAENDACRHRPESLDLIFGVVCCQLQIALFAFTVVMLVDRITDRQRVHFAEIAEYLVDSLAATVRARQLYEFLLVL